MDNWKSYQENTANNRITDSDKADAERYKTNQRYDEIKSKLDLSDLDVSKIFGYKSSVSMRNSRGGFDKTKNALISIYELIESRLQEKKRKERIEREQFL